MELNFALQVTVGIMSECHKAVPLAEAALNNLALNTFAEKC